MCELEDINQARRLARRIEGICYLLGCAEIGPTDSTTRPTVPARQCLVLRWVLTMLIAWEGFRDATANKVSITNRGISIWVLNHTQQQGTGLLYRVLLLAVRQRGLPGTGSSAVIRTAAAATALRSRQLLLGGALGLAARLLGAGGAACR